MVVKIAAMEASCQTRELLTSEGRISVAKAPHSCECNCRGCGFAALTIKSRDPQSKFESRPDRPSHRGKCTRMGHPL